MKFSRTFIPTLREVPADAVIASHRLMFRSGMLRKLANGLFAYLPLGLFSFRKLEQIIREEMNAIGSLEIKPTVVVPGELWKESGRWDLCGKYLNLSCVLEPVVSTVNFIRSRGLNHRQFRNHLSEVEAEYPDLPYHTAVRWLSSGKVLLTFKRRDV
jgi:hypothetical protein